MTNEDQPDRDLVQRFVFDDSDIRGEIIHLDRAYAEAIDGRNYSPAIAELVGEFMLASALMCSTLKFKGRLLLQARGEGDVAMIVAECSNDYRVRAVAKASEDIVAAPLSALFPGGVLTITIEPEDGQRYQGIVALSEESLAACLEDYFARSEQLKTRFFLAANGQMAGGLMLQALPRQLELDADAANARWQHIEHLASTLKPEELLDLGQEKLLYRLYHEEPLRLLEQTVIRYQCSCSRARTESAILSVAREEIEQILAEDGVLSMDCQFCLRAYVFTQEDVAQLYLDDGGEAVH